VTVRRRRAFSSAVGALVVAVVCAVLSANVDGGRRTALLVLTVAWLVIAAVCLANGLRTAPALEDPTAEPAPSEVGPADEPE
jgi:hypothetical protein